MALFQVQIENPQVHGGDTLRGVVRGEWPAGKIFAQWRTEGKGTPDQGPIQVGVLTRTGGDQISFEIAIPTSPRSYSGKILKIRWVLVVSSGRETSEHDIEVLPPRSAPTHPYRDASR